MAITALTLSSVDEQIKLLGTAPQIMPRLQMLLSDANTNPDDILDLIQMDTALAARVIKASNSAYFSPGFRVCTIDEAVTYLGYDEVYRILSILAFGRMMKAPLRHFGLPANQLWRRALCTALAMESIGKTVDCDHRVAYTVGLLHAVGMVFVDAQLVANKIPVVPDATEDAVRLLGLSHADVGAYVMRMWNFPEDIVEPVRCQFQPLDCLTKGRLACILGLGKSITSWVTRPTGIPAEPAMPDPLVLSVLNLSHEDYTEALEETDGKFTLLEIATSDY
ncbi:hypothetical protein ASA1KI_17610 [Opitutales bacterium ASA1]|uniref:HDOD domain-containing protein n=1 Tax=Congregicoccus parvus TaxID=3081749 RepID=UPI002B30E183|nr:hypothetical protein ASA1KI_17610 [Opitutales bacterium ASA1]